MTWNKVLFCSSESSLLLLRPLIDHSLGPWGSSPARRPQRLDHWVPLPQRQEGTHGGAAASRATPSRTTPSQATRTTSPRRTHSQSPSPAAANKGRSLPPHEVPHHRTEVRSLHLLSIISVVAPSSGTICTGCFMHRTNNKSE